MKRTTKRMLSAAVSAAVILSGTVSGIAFATDADGLSSAIVTAKSKFDIPAELTEFESNIISDENGTEYELCWKNETSDDLISITQNTKGDTVNFYTRDSEYSDREVAFPALDKSMVTEKAYEWLSSVNPEWIAELPKDKIADNSGGGIRGGNTYVYPKRYKNDIRFLNDGVRFEVDNTTGEVKSMSATWTYDDNVPSPAEALSVSEAKDKFVELSPIELVYETADDKTAYLVYRLSDRGAILDAVSGGAFSNTPSDLQDKNESASDSAVSGGSGGSISGLSASELKNLEQIENLKSEDELKTFAVNMYGTELKLADYVGCGYRRVRGMSGEVEYRATLSFTFDKDTQYARNASATFDAQTGELISYYCPRGKKSALGIDSQENKQHAEECVERFINNSAEMDLTSLDPIECTYTEYSDSYLFTYSREENALRFPANKVWVSADAQSGTINSFQKSWDKNIQFEDTDNLISLEEANNIIKNNMNLELCYKYSYEKDGERYNKKLALAYTINTKSNTSIYAKSGDAVKADSSSSTIYPTDTKGHYAEAMIKKLIDNGVNIADSEAFRPDDTITKGELASMAACLRRGYYSSAADTELLKNYDIIRNGENYTPDSNALRSDGVKYIIRALGYGKPAELKNIYICDFADSDNIPEEIRGYAALAKGFGIVNGDENGCFNPNDELTRADAAIMIYNYLAR